MSRWCFNCGQPTPASTVLDRLQERATKLHLTRCITNDQKKVIDDLIRHYEQEFPGADDRRAAR